MNSFLTTRPRRLRRTSALRDMVRETIITTNDLIYPIFVEEEISDPIAIPAIPGIFRIPESRLASEIEAVARDGIKAVLLFGISHHKDAIGSDSLKLICPLLSGPKLMIFWMTKETRNAEQEASPGRDYRQAA